jgi:hypothetical protein
MWKKIANVSGVKILIGKPESKIPLRKHRPRCNNITMKLKELGYGDLDWIHLA